MGTVLWRSKGLSPCRVCAWANPPGIVLSQRALPKDQSYSGRRGGKTAHPLGILEWTVLPTLGGIVVRRGARRWSLESESPVIFFCVLLFFPDENSMRCDFLWSTVKCCERTYHGSLRIRPAAASFTEEGAKHLRRAVYDRTKVHYFHLYTPFYSPFTPTRTNIRKDNTPLLSAIHQKDNFRVFMCIHFHNSS